MEGLVTLIGLGALLMAGSWAYQRLEKRFRRPDGEPT
jgi:hypothetical protein